MAIKLTDWMKQDPYGNPYKDTSVKKNDWSGLIDHFNDLYMNDLLKKSVLDSWHNDWTDEEMKKKFEELAASKETDEDKVARILKGDFEKKFGMTFEKFIEVYHKMLENSPEKLI